ncbi:MAG: hypothetical protein ACQESF_02365 [Nanobdellota archaeon]
MRFKFKENINQLFKRRVFVADKLVFISAVLLLGIFRPDNFIIFAYFLIYPYLYLTLREELFIYVYVSTLFGIIWTIMANDYYGYNQSMIHIFGLNSIPLFGWSGGLFGVFFIYININRKLQKKSLVSRFLGFTALYVFFLIFVETISYHFFGIHNIANSAYSGLPLCDCIHAPFWMKSAYFLMGPVYFLACEVVEKLGLNNPENFKKRKLFKAL